MLNVLFVQAFGLVGFILLLLSYWKKNIDRVLFLHMFSSIFYALHYYLLGANAALGVVILELFRDFLYYKTDKDKYIFIGIIPFYFLSLLFTYNGLSSFFPIVASMTDGFGLSIKKETAVIGSIISCIFWLIYDAIFMSYVGILASSIMIVSNIFVLIKGRFNK